MKKSIFYLALATITGLLGGYVIFGDNSDISNKETSENHKHTQGTENEMWTCSMHPQIMKTEAGDCPICGMDLIPAASSAEGLAANEIKMTNNAMALANIQTSFVGVGTSKGGETTVSLSGKIINNQENNSIQASYFEGRLEQLNINYEGQLIKQGQLLATIYAPELIAAQQELITAASLKETQAELYRAVRMKLKLWKLSENQINEIETSGKVKERFPIYATISGTVLTVLAAEGDYVKQGQPILKVNKLHSVWAAFDVYESQISKFQKGQQITVSTTAYPNKEFKAVISFIDPIVNSETRIVSIRATLNNTDNLFKPGMFVTGKIKPLAPVQESLISIPATAVMWTGERSLVYVKTHPKEAIFEMREIILGRRNGDFYSVTAGIKNGDEIVTNGTFTVDAAAQLQGKKSMMNKSGNKTTTAHQGHIGMKAPTEKNTNASAKMKLPQGFVKEFQSVVAAYLKMKNAFVSSQSREISIFAEATKKTLISIDLTSLAKMEQSHINNSIKILSVIAENEDLEKQRENFVILNENIVALTMNLKGLEVPLYVQKCPMANNNKGAIWLSKEKNIFNPYFGDSMLRCGSIIEELN